MANINRHDSRHWLFNTESREYSLRNRLVLRVGAVLLIAWAVAAVCAKFFSYDQTRDFLSNQSRVLSQNLLHLTSNQGNFSIDQSSLDSPIGSNTTQLIYIWRGEELLISQGQFNFKQPSRNETYVKNLNGFNWVLSASCNRTDCVLVGFRDQERKYLVRRIVTSIFAGLLFFLSIAMIAMYFAIKSGLKPLDDLAQELSENDVSKLKKIKDEENVKELKPLVSSLNQLMLDMQNQLKKEREFLDTCAHELRTPVAGLVAQIQSYSAQPAHHALHQTIKSAAERTIRVANQFLSLAKNNNAKTLSSTNSTFDFPELVRQVSADILSQHRHVNCQLSGMRNLQVNADALALEMVIQNLLENACRHGSTPGVNHIIISIDITQRHSCCILSVEDSGNGVPLLDRDKLTQRFFRSQTHHQSSGAGLGLSIVNEVASRYSGTVTIDKSHNLGGLRVSVSFDGICETQSITARAPYPATAAGYPLTM